MTSAVTTRHQGGVAILSLEGSAGATLFSTLQSDVVPTLSGQPVVLDITALTIAGPDAFRQLTSFLRWSSETLAGVCLVCRRLSARRLLHRSGATDVVPVFMTVEEAVEALLAWRLGAGPADAPGVGAEPGGRSGRGLAQRVAAAGTPPARRYAPPMGGEA